MADINKDLVRIDYLQGMKYKDIAAKFGVSIDTIKSWVKRYGWSKDRKKVKEMNAHKKVEKKKEDCTQNKKVSNSKKEGAKDKRGVQKEKPIIDDYEPIPYIENKDLNDKQKLFCIYYTKRFNATKAYQKAYGCSYATAMVEGSKALRNPKIGKEIEHLKADKLKGAYLSPQDILQRYIDVALSDINDYTEYGCKEVPAIDKKGQVIKDQDGKPLTYKMNYVLFKNSEEVDGTLISEISQGKDGAKIKLESKKGALDFLAKYSGLLDIPTQQKLDIERRKMELAEKSADTMDDDIEYTVEGGIDEDKEEN